MAKSSKIDVQGIEITITSHNNEDYICLTDMMKAKDGDFFISDWLRNVNTLEYLAAWEGLNNPTFNYGEFAIIRSSSGTNSYKISVKEWVEKTNSIGILAKTGRYGGTYAHKDIAFNFGMWISPAFQLYIVKEYQRLKEVETNQYGLEWDVRRVLSKANYTLHTDAIKEYIIPKSGYQKHKEWLLYAEEADLLNIALFGCTAKDWRDANPQRHLKGENIRDIASINELAILSNLESLNSTLIKGGMEKSQRFRILSQTALEQKQSLDKLDILKSIKKITSTTYIENQKRESDFDQKLKKGLDFNPNKDKN